MDNIQIAIKIIWGIIVGLIMVVVYRQFEGLLLSWDMYNYITIVIVGVVSYVTTYLTKDLIDKAF